MKRFGCDASGQSAVEAAIALPILLLLVLAIADLGRLGYYAIAVSQATRNAAAYAALNPGAPNSYLQALVCDELRLDTGCVPAPSVSRTSLNATVTVTYQFQLITGVIAQRFGVGSIPLTVEATFPGYTQ